MPEIDTSTFHGFHDTEGPTVLHLGHTHPAEATCPSCGRHRRERTNSLAPGSKSPGYCRDEFHA